MAITDIYNSLTFGGINSLDYGVYISGPAVYNAPTRDVELVSVPGRNGAIEIDKGHWNNIEVTYKAGTFGDDQSDFATKINAFRNAIVSQIGYQRITDTYNPEEYRLGIYLSGLSVNAVKRNEAGEFDLVFNCKPQRYLIDGETPIQVSSGDTITNPTLYDAGPLLAIEGYGNLNVNGYEIDIDDAPLGPVRLRGAYMSEFTDSDTISFTIPIGNTGIINIGDVITLKNVQIRIIPNVISSGIAFRFVDLVDAGGFSNIDITKDRTFSTFLVVGTIDEISFTYGDTETFEDSFSFRVRTLEPATSKTIPVALTIQNAGTNELSGTITAEGYPDLYTNRKRIRLDEIVGDSTLSTLGHPTYIDCEIGDAYKIENDEVVDLNSAIALGSDLPKLNPGENAVTFDDTIASLEITPRWWEL